MPVKEYVYSLPKADIEAITADFEIIRDRGILSNAVETRKLKDKLWEIKTVRDTSSVYFIVL
jgi:hypothetical protein